ncbi:MAG: hypothetical protein R2909_17315 [Gemmatimonadales bacterium]
MRNALFLLAAVLATGCVGDTIVQVADGVAGAVQGQVLDQNGTPVAAPGVGQPARRRSTTRAACRHGVARRQRAGLLRGFVVDEEPQDALLVSRSPRLPARV